MRQLTDLTAAEAMESSDIGRASEYSSRSSYSRSSVTELDGVRDSSATEDWRGSVATSADAVNDTGHGRRSEADEQIFRTFSERRNTSDIVRDYGDLSGFLKDDDESSVSSYSSYSSVSEDEQGNSESSMQTKLAADLERIANEKEVLLKTTPWISSL